MFVEQPTMSRLFEQLGLDSSNSGIEEFIAQHKGLNKNKRIEDAPFWTQSQATFLRSAFEEDADWVEVIDQLNVQLHHS